MQEWFNNGGKIDDIQWEILGKGEKSDEHKLISENECCNERKPFSPKIQNIMETKGRKAGILEYNREIYDKDYMKEYNKNYDKSIYENSPLGKLTKATQVGRNNLNRFIKEGRDDMERRWFWRTVERYITKREFIKRVENGK
jgi:hypothetical protein